MSANGTVLIEQKCENNELQNFMKRTIKCRDELEYVKLKSLKDEIDREYTELISRHNKIIEKLKDNTRQIDENELETNYLNKIPSDNYFKNPNCIPLDKLIIYIENDDEIIEISAISSYWTASWTYGYYEDSISLADLNKLDKGFQWLVGLPCYRFWSQIIYVKNTLKAIKSFIYHRNLYFYSRITESDEYNKYYASIYKSVFEILLRLVETEVSKIEKLPVETHARYIKEKKIFTYDMILPICKLYYGYVTCAKIFFHKLFHLCNDLRIEGIAKVGIECSKVLPFLSNHFENLPVLYEEQTELTFIAFSIVLNFAEDVLDIKHLLQMYPPIAIVLNHINFEQNLMEYVGAHLHTAGKILAEFTKCYESIDCSDLWRKFTKIVEDFVSVYRIFITAVINDILNVSCEMTNIDKIEIKQLLKRYVSLLELVFEHKFVGSTYVKLFNIIEDHQKILDVHSELEKPEKDILDKYTAIGDKLKEDVCQFDIKLRQTSDTTPRNSTKIDVWTFYTEKYTAIVKQELINATDQELRQLKEFDSGNKTEFILDEKSDEPNKIIEICMKKGFINGLNNHELAKNFLMTFVNPKQFTKSLERKRFLGFRTTDDTKIDDNSEITARRKKAMDTKVEMVYQRFLASKREPELLDTASKQPNEIASGIQTMAQRQATNTITTDYTDDEGAMRRAISESLKETSKPNHVEDVVFQSLISEVKDILPHLGEGFIAKCLTFYNNKTDETISAILEERLDPSLQAFDQSLPLIPEEKIEPIKRTIFDGDEADRMIRTTNKFDLNRIFRKKNKLGTNSVRAFLNDKTDVNALKERYQQYSLDYYNDDYDEDDYGDDVPISERPEEIDDKTLTKPLNRRISVEDLSSDESEDETETSTKGPEKTRDAFCEDPAVLRARAEARRNQKMQRRGSGHQANNRDVVGNAKGQGQDKNVLHNRAKKNEHKSQKANHNRRAGAQWKRNRGMLPS